MNKIQPQPGPQTQFLSVNCDIIIYGGEAGGGKTYGLLLEPTRHIYNGQANAVLFRRTTPQITQAGGVWDTSFGIYPKIGGKPNLFNHTWKWPSGFYIKMDHLQYEADAIGYDGAQIPLLLFDELRSFTEFQFFYLLTRNRSISSDIKPYVRATTNPDPEGWLRDFLDWWIGEDGHAIEERCGIIRYFVRIDDQIHWADFPDELVMKFVAKGYEPEDIQPKSLTFIHATLDDNPILKMHSPDYKSNILAQHKIERDRLLGNWDSIGQAGDYFQDHYFEMINRDELPSVRRQIRFWDRASTEKKESNDPDATCSFKISKDENGMHYIEDFTDLHFLRPGKVKRMIKNYASDDGIKCTVGLSHDPASAGEFEIEEYITYLSEYNIFAMKETKNKETRAAPVSTQAEHGNIKMVKGDWNGSAKKYLGYFPTGRYKDPIDALSGGYNFLTTAKIIDKLVPEKSDEKQTPSITKSTTHIW